MTPTKPTRGAHTGRIVVLVLTWGALAGAITAALRDNLPLDSLPVVAWLVFPAIFTPGFLGILRAMRRPRRSRRD